MDEIFESDKHADFRTVIRHALDRGLTIHPVKPRGKEPWLSNWPKQASRDEAKISEWCTRFPTSNYGVVATEDFCILESDNLNELQSRLSRDLPHTYVVEARENRPHGYFRQTDASRAAGNMDCPGVFEFKQHNRYVVGEGSIHPSGALYKCRTDAPIVEIPDWLVSDLQAIRAGTDLRVSAPLPSAGEKLGVGEGRHPMLMSAAAKMWDGERTREELFEDLEAVNTQHCEPPRSAAHLMSIVDWIMQQEPLVRAPKVEIGSTWGTEMCDLRAREIQPRVPLMVQSVEGRDDVLFYESSINQIFAWRGIGKTLFALGLAGTFAGGPPLLDFRSNKPVRVIYVDGELPLDQLRERAELLGLSKGIFGINPEDITPPEPINLLKESHWNKLIQAVDRLGAKVLFIDSISTCMKTATNEEDAQIEIQTKLNILRNRHHLCVITLHHAGKNGQQRGHSRNDDNLDIQMNLKQVDGWTPGDGLQFEMAFEKIRHAAKLESGYQVTYEGGVWKKQTSELLDEVRDLLEKGKSERAIAKELKISKSKVQRIKIKIDKIKLSKLNEGATNGD